MRKSYKYRLYPNQQEKVLIDKILETCRWLYNYFLAERRDKYEKEQKKVSYTQQQNSLPELKETNHNLRGIYSQVLQDVAQRVKKAFQGLFLRLKSKTSKAGYPRFKSFGRYDSFTYSQNNGSYKLEQDKLRLANIGKVKIKLHRELVGEIKTCSIIVKNGKYYACFSCEVESKLLPKTNKKVGIDLGLTSFLATSEGELYQAPKTYRKSEKQLAKAQRKVSRRIKKSKRRKKAVILLAKQHEKVSNQRKDLAHKLAKELVEKYDVAETGKQGVEVNAKNTSQICSECDKQREQKLQLSQRKFTCSFCPYSDNRDINAARNILKRAEWVGSTLQGAVSLEAIRKRRSILIKGSVASPRVVLSESNRYLRVQAIDDAAGHTLLASSTQDFVEKDNNFSLKNRDYAKKLGEVFAEKLKKSGQKKIVFDRNGQKSHNSLEKEKVVELVEGQLIGTEEIKEKPVPEITNKPESTNSEDNTDLPTNRKSRAFSDFRGREREKREYFRSHIQKTILKTWRPVKVTKGGRRFSFTSLTLIKDEEKKSVAYAHMGGKEPMKASAKAFRKAQKKLLNYFSTAPRTIPRDIT
ncbi:25801_t:CDS:2, partial [Racocetra persica]